MITTVGKLRNITTGILHTNIDDVYEFFEIYTNEKGIMTHHLGSATKAMQPILKTKLSKQWFYKKWNKLNNDLEWEVSNLTEDERKLFFSQFNKYNLEVWNKMSNKSIIVKL